MEMLDEKIRLTEEWRALFTCACLVNGSWPKRDTADCVFVPGLAVNNWQEDEVDDGILNTAAALHHQAKLGRGGARVVAIPGYTATMPQGRGGAPSPTGYPGVTAWQTALTMLGVPELAIALYACDEVGPEGKSWNTRTEADDFVRLAGERGWTSAVVLATPFHLLRVLCTLVRVLNDVKMRLRLLPLTPRSVSWTKEVYHSQGAECLPRFVHIQREWMRILQYRENGSLCSFQDLASYLLASINTP